MIFYRRLQDLEPGHWLSVAGAASRVAPRQGSKVRGQVQRLEGPLVDSPSLNLLFFPSSGSFYSDHLRAVAVICTTSRALFLFFPPPCYCTNRSAGGGERG